VYALDPSQAFPSGIAAFNFNAGTGALTPVMNSPFQTSPFATAMAATTKTAFLYVADWMNKDIIIYKADSSSGALSQLSTLPVPGFGYPGSMLISPNSSTLYIADGNGMQIWAFSIASDGGLTTVSGSPYKINDAPSFLTMDAGGHLLFASGVNNQVWAFTVGSNGGLTAVAGSPTTVRAPFSSPGKGPTGVTAALDPQARFLFVLDGTAPNMYVYSVSATGMLTQISGSPFAIGVTGTALAVSPSGKFVYAAGYGQAQIAAMAVNQSSGALTLVPGSPFDNGPFRNGGAPISDAHVDASGKYLVLADSENAEITVFAIDQSTGALTNVSGSPFKASSFSGAPYSIQLTQ
jgi:sugar lactone lactonase YvrE